MHLAPVPRRCPPTRPRATPRPPTARQARWGPGTAGMHHPLAAALYGAFECRRQMPAASARHLRLPPLHLRPRTWLPRRPRPRLPARARRRHCRPRRPHARAAAGPALALWVVSEQGPGFKRPLRVCVWGGEDYPTGGPHAAVAHRGSLRMATVAQAWQQAGRQAASWACAGGQPAGCRNRDAWRRWLWGASWDQKTPKPNRRCAGALVLAPVAPPPPFPHPTVPLTHYRIFATNHRNRNRTPSPPPHTHLRPAAGSAAQPAAARGR